MAELLVCNETNARLGLLQVETTQPQQLILSRECFTFNWTTQKYKPVSRKIQYFSYASLLILETLLLSLPYGYRISYVIYTFSNLV
jgi:hypothetical protein